MLRALAQARLPEERPNYDYFAQLLAFESQIAVKPKRCWIFVAHNDVAVRADGGGYNPATGEELSEDDYPHLKENLVKESWPREDKAMLPGTLLHRFTKMLEQVESSSVREIGSQWATDFPELAARLDAATAGSEGSDGHACCDILHMHLTLEMQRRRHFPAQSELNSWVEINVEQPRLLNHRWKVVTRLMRPAELSRGTSGGANGSGNSSSGNSSNSSNGGTLYETSAEMGVQYVHQPRCEGPISGHSCDCVSQSQRQVVSVPFPADVWARTLTSCAEYPAHPLVLDRSDGREAVKSEHDEHEERSIKSKIKRHLTQMELVPKIAMFQEVWSCPPGPQDMDSFGPSQAESRKRGGGGRWKRRAVLLWTFETVHSVSYTMRGRNELVTAPEGKGQWRFLTTLDPTSQYHQKQSLLSPGVLPGMGAGAGPNVPVLGSSTGAHHHLSRDAVMSPTPSYQQHLNASMNENFALAWDVTSGGSIPSYPSTVFSHGQSSHQGGQGLYPPTSGPMHSALDSFSSHGGLATPPPSASLSSSFAQSFTSGHHGHAAGDVGSQGNLGNFMAAVTSAGMDGSSNNSLVAGSGGSSVADQFLSAAAAGNGAYGGVYDDVGAGAGSLHNWDIHNLPSVDSRLVPNGWSSSYPATTIAATTSGVLDWATPSQSHGNNVGGAKATPPSTRRGSATGAGINPLDDRDGWAAGVGAGPTPVSDGTESDCAPVAAMCDPDQSQESCVALPSLPQDGVENELTVPEVTETEQQEQPQVLYESTHQQGLSRHKSLKRSREDSVGDQENDHPRHCAKIARYSNIPTTEIDWDGVSSRAVS